MNASVLYLITFVSALLICIFATPMFRFIAIKFNIMDSPITQVKTHKVATPYLGGLAISLSCLTSLFIIRLITQFPDGTLAKLRGIFYGGIILVILGLVDDMKYKGLGYKSKLFVQFIAAAIVVFGFDIRINFIHSYVLSSIISIIWIVGISNAFNIIDIMDGLSSGIALIASFAFLFISLPTEMIYVNFAAIALAGAILGFMPYNLSKSKKIFMGDCGSLFIGFVLATLAMGTSYTSIETIGVFTPILILAIPIYETILVSWFRIKKGKSPFMGSKDHYALRLEKMGFSRKQILFITYLVCISLACCAYLFTVLSAMYEILLFLSIIFILWLASISLAKVKVD